MQIWIQIMMFSVTDSTIDTMTEDMTEDMIEDMTTDITNIRIVTDMVDVKTQYGGYSGHSFSSR